MKVILVVIDTLRADHLGCYGYFRDTSPTIDQLASKGVVFDDFHASGVATGPAFSSIVTGLFPINHGFYFTPFDLPNEARFDDSIPTLAEIIQENGSYATASFDNLLSFRSHMTQIVRGCDYTGNPSRGVKVYGAAVDGEQINRMLLPWLRQHASEDFFAFVHYWDPHTPYVQPDPYREMFKHEKGNMGDLKIESAAAGYEYVPGWGKVGELWEEDTEKKCGQYISSERSVDLYDGAIRYTDHLISQIVDTLKEKGVLEDTVLMITSDHGELLGQHGIYGHTGVYEANTWVPLVMYGPERIPQGKNIKGYSGHIDIAPTILDLLGAENIPRMDGESLMSAMDHGESLRQTAFMEFHTCRGVLKEDWKYIKPFVVFEKGAAATQWARDGGEELYNIKQDPMEVNNLAGKEFARQKELREELERWAYENLAYRSDPIIAAVEMRDKARKESYYKHGMATRLPWNKSQGK